MQVTHMIVGRLRRTFPKLKSKYYTTIDKDSTTTSLSDTFQHIFKEKESTQQSIPLKMNEFHFNKNGEPQSSERGRAIEMADMIQVDNICSGISY